MIRVKIFIILTFCLSGFLNAQDRKREMEGLITYITSQNIYAKFPSARGIKSGDKIFVRKNGDLVPIMVVENTSSVSCVGKPLGIEQLKSGDKVVALISKEDAISEQSTVEVQQAQVITDSTGKQQPVPGKVLPLLRKERLEGRVQISSYSNQSTLANSSNNRMRYLWSLNASHIGNSRVSFDSYVSFIHQLNNWAPIKENIFNGLKIYDFNLKFDVGDSSLVWIGRKVNPKIANIGAIDGIQFEMDSKHFFWGVAAGFRPDYLDYSFNKNLLEFGAYAGHTMHNQFGMMQSSLAVFNQTNAGMTDRRYLYFQHDNSLLKNLNLFISSEVDLYKVVAGLPVNEMSLTSLYLMLNYRISNRISVSGSYDNRKNIIFYETYKNYIDMMLADATRQGVQFRVNVRPVNMLNLGLSGSYWDRAGDTRATQNGNAFMSYSQIPLIKATGSFTWNFLQTSYVDGSIYGFRVDKDLSKGRINFALQYRYVDYHYISTGATLLEHIGGVDFSWQLSRKFSMSLNYEGTFEPENTYHQIYWSLIRRF